MSIDTQAIRIEAHLEIGTLIHRDADLLVDRWCHRALREMPGVGRVHLDVLRDQLPLFLRTMGRSLSQPGVPARHEESAGEHGEQRWGNGWSLKALVRDYQILQLVILEHLELSLERPLRYREVMAIGVFIDDAVAASISQYVASRDEHVRQIGEERAAALVEAGRRKDEFIAMLAHELRNPLAPIINSVELLQLLLPGAGPDVLSALAVIKRQSRFMTALVDDLLDLSRIAQGRLKLRKEHLNLSAVIEQALQASEPVIKEQEHRLTVELPPEPLYLEGDGARLIQVVVNLLNNAAKYTARSGDIRLSVQREEREAMIRVEDNGIGIPPELQARVFDMFVQGEASTHHSSGGLGIGLTLVRRLVDLHGGTIVCESPGVGRGSVFTIRLPATIEEHAPLSLDPEEEPACAPVCHILLIEDHVDARQVLTKLLERSGHRVDSAGDGTGGLDLAFAHPPQIALVDIGLPDMDGYEVAKRLRAAHGRAIFLVALTGYGQTDDLRQALDAGFDAHLVKPTDLVRLEELLTKARCR